MDLSRTSSWSPLMLACTERGFIALNTIEFLLNTGADPYAKDSHGWNALFVATETGDPDIVTLLINRAPECVRNRSTSGQTALHIAAALGHAEVLEILIRTDPELLKVRDSFGATALDASLQNGQTALSGRLYQLITENTH